MRPQWQPRINLLLEELQKGPAVLRLSYLADVEDPKLVERRVEAMTKPRLECLEGRARRLSTWSSNTKCSGAPESRRVKTRGSRRCARRTNERLHTTTLLCRVAVAARRIRRPSRRRPSVEAVERHLPGDEQFMQWTPRSGASRRRRPATAVDTRGRRGGAGDRQAAERGAADPLRIRRRRSAGQHRGGTARARWIACATKRTCGCTSSVTPILNRCRRRLAERYGDNEGLSRERAGEVAELFQSALELAARGHRV